MAGLLGRLAGRGSPAAGLRRAQELIDDGRGAEAFPLLAKAAQAENAEAEFQVARSYLEGAGVPPSPPEGARWLERAANHGYAAAQSLLAALYVHGVAPQPASAAGLFAAPAAPANAPGPDFARPRTGRASPPRPGRPTGRHCSATSSPPAPRRCATSPRRRNGIARPRPPLPQGYLGYGLALLRKAASPAQSARVRYSPRRPTPDSAPRSICSACSPSRARGWSATPSARPTSIGRPRRRACAPARRATGSRCWKDAASRATCRTGESWLRRAALAGDPEAAALVGDLYARGGDLPPNHAEAAMWFRRAADAGHKTAARTLGVLHLTGAGVPRDPVEAARWFRVSAEAGDVQSRYDLAGLVLKGQAEPEDFERTREWFEQAASAGDLVAAYNYGVCLAEGVGVERDDARRCNGCAAPPRAWSTRSTGTAACCRGPRCGG